MEKIWNRLKNINWRALVPKVENFGPKLRFLGLRLLHPDRRLVVFIHDFFAMMLSLQLAFGIYYGDNLIYFSPHFITKQMWVYAFLCAGFFTWFQTYRYIWKYTNLKSLMVLWTAIALGTLAYLPLVTRVNIENIRVHAIMVLAMGIGSCVLVTLSRLVYRFGYLQWITPEDKDFADQPTARVLLVGMHNAHIEHFLKSLKQEQDTAYEFLGIVTEKPQNVGKFVRNIEVLGLLADLPEIVEELNAQGNHPHHVVITSDFYKGEKLRTMIEVLKPYHVTFKKFPPYQASEYPPHELLPIVLEDIYFAPTYLDDQTDLAGFYQKSTILVTGAATGLGPMLCEQLLTMGATKLVVCDSNHYELAALKEKFADLVGSLEIHYVLTFQYSVAKYERLIKHYGIDMILHLDGILEEEVALENALETINENILTPRQLVAVARNLKVRFFAQPFFPTFEVQGILTKLTHLGLQWCQMEDAVQSATRVLAIPLPHMLSPEARWIQKLRKAKITKPLNLKIASEFVPLMTPQRAAFSFLKTIFIASQSNHRGGILMEQSPHRLSISQVLRHIHEIYPLDLENIHWAVDPLLEPKKHQEKIVFDTENYLFETYDFKPTTLNATLMALEKAVEEFDSLSVEKILNA